MILGGDINDPENVAFANAIGAPKMIWGWEDAVRAKTESSNPAHSIGMTEYVRQQGGIGITIECGNHDHPRGRDFAFQAACNVIEYLGLADIFNDLKIQDIFQENTLCIRLEEVVFRDRAGDFTKDRLNFEKVKAREKIITYEDGSDFCLPQDGYLVMPKRDASIGTEWLYWGVEKQPPVK